MEGVREGRFREDLYYRLNVIEIPMPALRDRRDDVALLANHFLDRFARSGDRDLVFSEDAMARLIRHDWPGNVRELENAVERAVALADTDTIEVVDLPAALREDGPASISGGSYAHLSLQEAREGFEQAYISEALTKTGGNITHAAKMAGIAWQNFHQKLKKYGIDAKSFARK